MFRVYRQDDPIPTGRQMRITNYKGEQRFEIEHVANLHVVGYALSMEDAKVRYPFIHPILERIEE